MSDLLKWDMAVADATAQGCDRLVEVLEGVCRDMRSYCDQLEASCAGLTVESYRQYVEGPAQTNINSVAGMMAETSAALKHTSEQFASADYQLKKTFHV